MANFNKVVLIGRLTRDPEARTFPSGGKVTKFGFAVTNRRKNTQSGQWEDEPMFIDVEVYNRGEFGKTADLVEERCRKGSQVMIEGRLHLDQWDDKQTGQKRSKHKIVVETVQLLDPRTGGDGGGYGAAGGDEMDAPAPAPRAGGYGGGNRGGGYNGGPSRPPARPAPAPDPDDAGGQDGEIPF